MKALFLVDVINFNADASCLSAQRWLEVLSGGYESEFYRWLSAYVRHNRKAVLGLPGATVADIQSFCPEGIQFVNENPAHFEVLLRPYAHDLAVLRTDLGFYTNCKVGFDLIQKTFKNICPWFLPPEFTLSASQVITLREMGVRGLFINLGRFKGQRQERLPKQPYRIQTFDNEEMPCIPFTHELTLGYLSALHHYRPELWNEANKSSKEAVLFSWRDAESPFFIPDSLNRELNWLKTEAPQRERLLLSEALPKLTFEQPASNEGTYTQYPAHTLMPWLREMRMLGFVQNLYTQELDLESFNSEAQFMWLQCINSDILSAIEKDSPKISIKIKPEDIENQEFTIWRTDRGTEGEAFLWLLQQARQGKSIQKWLQDGSQPYLIKIYKRLKLWENA